jgi:hypothetical protein
MSDTTTTAYTPLLPPYATAAARRRGPSASPSAMTRGCATMSKPIAKVAASVASTRTTRGGRRTRLSATSSTGRSSAITSGRPAAFAKLSENFGERALRPVWRDHRNALSETIRRRKRRTEKVRRCIRNGRAARRPYIAQRAERCKPRPAGACREHDGCKGHPPQRHPHYGALAGAAAGKG